MGQMNWWKWTGVSYSRYWFLLYSNLKLRQDSNSYFFFDNVARKPEKVLAGAYVMEFFMIR